MKISILALAFATALPALAQTSAPTDAAHPSPYNFPGVQFPRIEADRRVSFRFVAPNAQKVQVSIVNVASDMVKGEDGAWTYTTKDPQAPGYHNYWMIVDGAIVLDPATNAFIGYGHMCNGFEIPDPEGAFYQIKEVPHGSVQLKNYYSKTAKEWRQVRVYTPPGYDANTSTRYPVLYLQHGGGEDGRVWTEMGRTHVILDNLLTEGKVTPMIVVMETSGVGAPPPRPAAPATPPVAAATAAPTAGTAAPSGGAPVSPASGGGPGRGGRVFNFTAFERLLIDDLIPYIDANFRTRADQPHRAMAGLSMGGMQTRSIAPAHLELFSHIGVFSGGSIAVADIKDMAAFKEKVKAVFFSFGGLENGAPAAKAAAAALKEAGVNSTYYESPQTAHEWQTWRRSLREFAPLLFKS
jgi:enterochelin esterase-like enzyme